MVDFITKAVIKDYKNIDDPKVRHKYGILSGVISIICNIILFTAKIIIGIFSGSISIVADAFNNLSDMASCIVTIIGFKMASKPADSKHPFGHGRIEYVAGHIVAFTIVVMGVELIKSSFESILNPIKLEISITTVAVLAASIGMKIWMGYFNGRIGKKINSPALKAASKDSFSDCIATSVVLGASILQGYTGINVDGFAGLCVAVFVIIAGITSANDTIQPLLGEMPSEELVRKIREEVLEDKRVLGAHDIMVHNYGPGRTYVSLDAELPVNLTLLKAHDIIDAAEKRIKEKLNCEVSIHVDPIDNRDKETLRIKNIVEVLVHGIDPDIKIHDFQLVNNDENKRLSFDVEIPCEKDINAKALSMEIERRLRLKDINYGINITIDRCYIHEFEYKS